MNKRFPVNNCQGAAKAFSRKMRRVNKVKARNEKKNFSEMLKKRLDKSGSI